MLKRIKTLSDTALMALACRVFQTIDNLMSQDSQPFGWDWPTAHVLYPTKAKLWQMLCNECKTRNIVSVPIKRYTNRNGKIICVPA